MKAIIIKHTFCCDKLWKSIIMALENFGNCFLLLCGHPDWVAGGCESRNCHSNVDRFQNSFTLTILDKSVTKSLQKNSQHLIRVSTVHSVLPGAVLMHSGQWLGFSVAPCRMFVRQCESFEQLSHRSEIAVTGRQTTVRPVITCSDPIDSLLETGPNLV